MTISDNPSFVDMVREFHRACEYGHSERPSVDDPARRELWEKLITEEVGELLEALASKDAVKVADGLADVIYVCIGAALGFGIPIDAVFQEVHRSNLSKIGSSTRRREDGKILRGDAYTPPNISDLLK